MSVLERVLVAVFNRVIRNWFVLVYVDPENGSLTIDGTIES